MLLFDTVSPFKIIRSGLMGNTVFHNSPDRKCGKYIVVNFMGKMIVYCGYTGKNALIAA
jgi:hypothetical protein